MGMKKSRKMMPYMISVNHDRANMDMIEAKVDSVS